jgi:hypothetical protein
VPPAYVIGANIFVESECPDKAIGILGCITYILSIVLTSDLISSDSFGR